MSERKRLRRPQPARTSPIRNFSTLLKTSNGKPQVGATAGEPDRGTDSDDAVAAGVKLGYSVIEDQILKGQRVAQQLNERLYGREPGSTDVADIYQRLLRFSSDLGSLYLELLDTVARSANVDQLFRSRAAPDGTGPAAESPVAASGIGIAVEALRPVEVTFNAWSTQCEGELLPQPLRALDPSLEPLTDVRFEYADGKPIRLRVVVSSGQSPGTYTGLIVDSETNDAKGSLSVHIAD